MQIKTTWWYYKPMRTAKNKNHWQQQVLVSYGATRIHTLLVGMQNGTPSLLDSLTYIYHKNRQFYSWLCLYKNLDTNIYRGSIHNYQTWNNQNILKWDEMDIQTVVYPYNKILLIMKRNKLLIHTIMRMKGRCGIEAPYREVTYHMIPLMRQSWKIMGTENRSAIARD